MFPASRLRLSTVLALALFTLLAGGCGSDDADEDDVGVAADDDDTFNDDTSDGEIPGDDASDDDGQPVTDDDDNDTPIDQSDDDTSGDQPAMLTPVSPEELHAELQAKDFLLINVHVPYAGEIPQTDAHIAYTEIDQLIEYIGPDLDVKVVVYCMSNAMSTNAGQKLVDEGYRAIRYLDGGMSGWQAAGYELENQP